MNMKGLFPVALLLLGFAAGYWMNGQDGHPRSNSIGTLAEKNHRLLQQVDDKLSRYFAQPSSSLSGRCADLSPLLPPLQQTLRESVESLAAPASMAGGSEMAMAAPSSPPSDEQEAMYRSVRQRIHAYASSGEPLLEAMAADQDFQRLSVSQKKQLAREVVQRFNRGEISLSQLQGE